MRLASFDNYSNYYDEHFTHSPIGIYQRQLVYRYLLPLLNKNSNVLEINCGTGYDAINMSKHVNNIIAADASSVMIENCLKNFKNHENNNLLFKVLSIQQINTELKGVNFIFSNFGGLNCLAHPEIEAFASKCKALLKKDSELFFVIMGRKCLWERLYFMIKLDFKKAFRRVKKSGVNTVINNITFKTWYYAPNEVLKHFESDYKICSTKGIGLFIPPSYLNPFFKHKTRSLKLLYKLDLFFCKYSWLANYSDHYIIHLKKIK